MNQKEINKQFANVKKCAERLSCKSFFQEEGWKRILGVRRFLEAFDLEKDLESFNLVTKELHVPIYAILSHLIPDLSTNVTKNIILSDIWKTGPFNFLCMLVNLKNDQAHAVVIYGISEDKKYFKIKDSHEKKYEIPISRCSHSQVSFNTTSIPSLEISDVNLTNCSF